MRKTMLLIILLISSSINSQDLSEKKIHKLNSLNIKTDNLNLNDFEIRENLDKILILDRKRKTNKTIAIVLSSIAVSGIIGGFLVSKGSKMTDDQDLVTIISGVLIASGVIYGGISVPFWTSSKKEKRKEIN